MTVATGLEREYARGASIMTAWESELASFMNDLSSVQNETLELLAQKRKCLASIDAAGLDALAGREDELINRLQDCLRRRAELLEKADQEGLPAGSIGDLAKTLPPGKTGRLERTSKAGERSNSTIATPQPHQLGPRSENFAAPFPDAGDNRDRWEEEADIF